jgi:hypothetical protein
MSKPKNEPKPQSTSISLTPRAIDLKLAQHGVPAWRVAHAMGIAPSTLSAWKLGASPAPADFASRLDAALRALTQKQAA